MKNAPQLDVLFVQVLLLAREMNLIKLGRSAIQRWNRGNRIKKAGRRLIQALNTKFDNNSC